MAESFFATLKTEFYYRRVWPTKARARLKVGAWIEDRYNRRRQHASLVKSRPWPSRCTCNTQTRSRTFKKPHNPVSTKRGQSHDNLGRQGNHSQCATDMDRCTAGEG